MTQDILGGVRLLDGSTVELMPGLTWESDTPGLAERAEKSASLRYWTDANGNPAAWMINTLAEAWRASAFFNIKPEPVPGRDAAKEGGTDGDTGQDRGG